MQIGNITLGNNLIAAPMAGVTDRPFRQLCKRLGAGMAVSEMVASDSRLWATEKSLRRGDHTGEVNPIVVQIAGDLVFTKNGMSHRIPWVFALASEVREEYRYSSDMREVYLRPRGN